MKIEVKDYYAIKRGEARSNKLSKEERIKIAKKAIQARWNKARQDRIRQEDIEDNKWRKSITR